MTRTDELHVAYNMKHKGKTIWYKATTAFDMILMFLREHPDKNTKNTAIIEFQAWLSLFIDEFIPKEKKWPKN